MKQLIPVADALTILRAQAPVMGEETCLLSDCLGRTLASNIPAKVSRPPADVSAMDGYAVRLSDVATPGKALKVIGEAPAGTPFDGAVQTGKAVRIFTGGEIPAGADHVVLQETVTRAGDTAIIEQAYTESAHIRRAGLDFAAGDLLLKAGSLIGPAALAVAAAGNHGALPVVKRPKVALLANGDELRPPGSALARGQIVSSNPAALSALITNWGGTPIDLGIAPDKPEIIQDFIQSAHEADIIVPIGGASVGDHDYMRAAFKALDYKTVFEKIAVKPGKPTWFARKGSQCVLGLPGNPASALVCAHLFLRPLLQPASAHSQKIATLGTELAANGRRTHFLRANVTREEGGRLIATPYSNQDSSLLHPFLSANALIQRAVDAPALPCGASVEVVMLVP